MPDVVICSSLSFKKIIGVFREIEPFPKLQIDVCPSPDECSLDFTLFIGFEQAARKTKPSKTKLRNVFYTFLSLHTLIFI